MNLAAVIHRPTLDYIYPKDRQQLCVYLHAAIKDMKKVTLVWWFRGETDNNSLRRVEMKLALEDEYVDYYSTTVNCKKLAAYVRYYFLLDDGKEIVTYGAKGFDNKEAQINENFFEFLWPNNADAFKAPSWANNLVYYQIFPERFNSGRTDLTPINANKWGSKPTRENFMGGDIQGIIDKLDYICDLGANCLYLTPIFDAPSNHKYDTVNYYEISPSFGNKNDLSRLVEEVHQRGMKILLDGVFNHSGYYWPIFQDVVKKGKESKYADWFFVHSYPVDLDNVNYDCVGHYKWMPKINLENKEAANYFLQVGEYWIREFNIDGWRLDVADEIPLSFWHKFVGHLKEINPEILLLGETWGDAGKLVGHNGLDSAMNYLLKDALVDWLCKKKIGVHKFNHLINRMYALYPEEVIFRLYNPLDSHDTARFLKECNDDIKTFKLAICLQMTLPGCPAIFYGDEIGLSGDNDPGCRLCMEWDNKKQNVELLSWYKMLIDLRKNTSALYAGDFKVLYLDEENNVYCYKRESEKDSVIVIINASEKELNFKLPINIKGFKSILNEGYITEDAYGLLVKIAANSVHILKKEKN